jgi:hypothetical protein
VRWVPLGANGEARTLGRTANWSSNFVFERLEGNGKQLSLKRGRTSDTSERVLWRIVRRQLSKENKASGAHLRFALRQLALLTIGNL